MLIGRYAQLPLPSWPFVWHPRTPGRHAVYPLLGPETLRDVTAWQHGAGSLVGTAALRSDPLAHGVLWCDGNSDYASIDGGATLLSEPGSATVVGSMSVWFQPTRTSVQEWVFTAANTSDTSTIVALLNNSGTAYVFVRNSGGQSSTPTAGTITAGRWHHLAVTLDGTTVRLYLDGVQTASAAAPGTFSTTLNTLSVGVLRRSTLIGYTSGRMYLARVCDAAWPAAEVARQADPSMMWDEAEEYGQRLWFLPGASGTTYFHSGNVSITNSLTINDALRFGHAVNASITNTLSTSVAVRLQTGLAVAITNTIAVSRRVLRVSGFATSITNLVTVTRRVIKNIGLAIAVTPSATKKTSKSATVTITNTAASAQSARYPQESNVTITNTVTPGTYTFLPDIGVAAKNAWRNVWLAIRPKT